MEQPAAFIRLHLRRFGVGKTALKGLAVALKRLGLLEVCNCQFLFGARLDPELLALPPHLEARFIGGQEVETLAADPRHALPGWFVKEALSKGDLCHAIFDGDRLASYGWYSARATLALGGFLHFPAGYAYMYHGYTLPSYRGLRLHGVGLTQALQHHLERGFRGFVTMVDTTNYPSRVSSYRMGFEDYGRFYKFGPGRRSRVLTTGKCRAMGVRISPRRESA